MFEFVFPETGFPAERLNDFLGAPFDSVDAALDLIKRMPEYAKEKPTRPEHLAAFLNAYTGEIVVLCQVQEPTS